MKKELIKDIFKGISPTRGVLFVTKNQVIGKNENGYRVYYYNIGKNNMKVKLIMEEELLNENVVSEITIEFIK